MRRPVFDFLTSKAPATTEAAILMIVKAVLLLALAVAVVLLLVLR